MAEFSHLSVMPAEVLRFLAPKPGGIYLDGTIGGGGHAEKILEASSPDGRVIGLDRDGAALAATRQRLAPFGSRAILVRSNFSELAEVLFNLGITVIDGFLLDLGVSSYQLDSGKRGFSFQQDAPLDMRMDSDNGESAAELVNRLDEDELARIISEYGEERWAKRIASFIVRARIEAPVDTTLRLVDIIKGAIPKGAWEERIHPATRTFQAIRIAVNDELGSLEKGLSSAVPLLRHGGRGVVISFHSLEDRIVKNSFRDLSRGCICPKFVPRCICGNLPRVKVLTGRPVMAEAAEILDNPRARSAKLRSVEKI